MITQANTAINEAMNDATEKVRVLLRQFQALEAAGAGKAAHADHDKRNQLLDELQDATGLAGRMVMEKDILRRAEAMLKG